MRTLINSGLWTIVFPIFSWKSLNLFRAHEKFLQKSVELQAFCLINKLTWQLTRLFTPGNCWQVRNWLCPCCNSWLDRHRMCFGESRGRPLEGCWLGRYRWHGHRSGSTLPVFYVLLQLVHFGSFVDSIMFGNELDIRLMLFGCALIETTASHCEVFSKPNKLSTRTRVTGEICCLLSNSMLLKRYTNTSLVI